MSQTQRINPGVFPLFRLFGIQVHLHWTWFIIAALMIQYRYSAQNGGRGDLDQMALLRVTLEYVSIFAIVLMHEFGHSLACRSVGGRADHIVLWPLGGVAFVQPPPRPGPTLWSIAAGPLVNVVLLPITIAIWIWAQESPDVVSENMLAYIQFVTFVNGGLLVFNMLPIYPLDGGQILQSLLWFIVGRSKSLMIVAVMGVIFGGMIGLLALYFQDWWLLVIVLFIVWRAVDGFRVARLLAVAEAQEKQRDQYLREHYAAQMDEQSRQ